MNCFSNNLYKNIYIKIQCLFRILQKSKFDSYYYITLIGNSKQLYFICSLKFSLFLVIIYNDATIVADRQYGNNLHFFVNQLQNNQLIFSNLINLLVMLSQIEKIKLLS